MGGGAHDPVHPAENALRSVRPLGAAVEDLLTAARQAAADAEQSIWTTQDGGTKLTRAEWVPHGQKAIPFLQTALREGLPKWGGPASGCPPNRLGGLPRI